MKWLNGYRMLLLAGFVIIIFLCTSSVCSALEYVWTQKADMPTPRWGHTSAVVNSKIYVIGGRSSQPGSRLLSTVEEYDPLTDTWITKADMPTARFGLSACVVDGRIYAIGGEGGRSVVEEYDPVAEVWIRKADMPTGRDYLATVTVEGKIYTIGGTVTYYNGFSTVEEYNPVTDTWTRKANMPASLWGLCANEVRGKIYTLGGRPDAQARPYVQEYEPTTDTWARKSDMPVGTSQMDSVVLGDNIIVIGGWLWSADFPYTTVQIYDPDTDTWTRESEAPFLRACHSAEVVNNKIYVIGGTDRPHPCIATSTVYELTINPPPPDFNGDGIIDSADMCIMIEYWGTDYSLCDIGPMPWGDGIVDFEDLKILSKHLFEEVDDPTLIAHWALDEAQGDIAYDSVADCDGVLIGDPVWQPDGGIVAGALQLEGIDDCIITDLVLNPADGKFSVVTWIKGGAPGQIVISQEGGADWLMTDIEGNLISELRSPGRNGNPILSETNIIDGNWHRISLVWDGSSRKLYVDGILAAEDTQDGLEGSDNGLYIGCGKGMELGTFWSGLIDDVRIYNREVIP